MIKSLKIFYFIYVLYMNELVNYSQDKCRINNNLFDHILSSWYKCINIYFNGIYAKCNKHFAHHYQIFKRFHKPNNKWKNKIP